MRILIDTNVLFSALLFPSSKPAQLLLYVADNHQIVFCEQNITELHNILKRKAPQYLPDSQVLLDRLSYEMIPSITTTQKLIRDPKDQPILNAAVIYGVDIIVTGDKDFLSLDLKRPKCMSVAEFLANEDLL